jgi:hypothetical protein
MLASPGKREQSDLRIGPTQLAEPLLPPWSWKLRSCWFSKAICIFLMKLAWKNGGNSTDVGISPQQRADAMDESENNNEAWIFNSRNF